MLQACQADLLRDLDQGLSPEVVRVVSPSELFGTPVEAVVSKFREVKAHSAIYIFF